MVRPLVRRVVAVGHRTDRDEADDAIVDARELRQLAGEGAVGVGVDQLTLASRAAYQSSHRSAEDAAV